MCSGSGRPTCRHPVLTCWRPAAGGTRRPCHRQLVAAGSTPRPAGIPLRLAAPPAAAAAGQRPQPWGSWAFAEEAGGELQGAAAAVAWRWHVPAQSQGRGRAIVPHLGSVEAGLCACWLSAALLTDGNKPGSEPCFLALLYATIGKRRGGVRGAGGMQRRRWLRKVVPRNTEGSRIDVHDDCLGPARPRDHAQQGTTYCRSCYMLPESTSCSRPRGVVDVSNTRPAGETGLTMTPRHAPLRPAHNNSFRCFMMAAMLCNACNPAQHTLSSLR